MRIFLCLILFYYQCALVGQSSDSLLIRKIYDIALTSGRSYEHLRSLCKEAPGRLAGSPASEKAISLTKAQLEAVGADSVWLQPVMVPYWERGKKETLRYSVGKKQYPLTACALGNSTGTSGPLEASVVMVEDLQDLEGLPPDALKGKFVFFRKAPDRRHIDTFNAYGGCAGARLYGADSASARGAVGILIHSLTLSDHDRAHTGVMLYGDKVARIPGMALSPQSAKILEGLLKSNPDIKLTMELSCTYHGMVPSYNVVGEIKGSQFPNEIVLVGGHLDAWDNGEGAHDDGAGVVHSIESIHIFKQLGIRPKRTLRVVLFMNEENGAFGAEAYADFAKQEVSKHIFALESDRGGFTPRGFTVETDTEVGMRALQRLAGWQGLLEPYFLHLFASGGSGVDVSRLRGMGCALSGFIPDSQRYFDHHHSHNDRFEEVNKRELEMGSAAISALLWLVTEYGIED
jgi:hypothetical protein